MMTCQDIQPLLSPSLDEALSATEERTLREHLALCDACIRRLDRLQVTRDAFRSTIPEPLQRRHRGRTPFIPPAAAAAAGIAAALLMLAFWFGARAPAVSTVTDDLVFMTLEPAAESLPCYSVSDCSIRSAAQMP